MFWTFIIVAGTLIITFVCIPTMIRDHERWGQHWRSFNDRFPPISEQQFLALCPPGTNPHIALTVRRTICECLAVDYERVYPSSRLGADLGAE